jgi:signal transduction histidine kinase
MRLNSLAFRLAASAALVSIVLLVSAGILLGNLFQQAVERNFDARLLAVLDGLLANVELAGDGSLTMQGALADTRFKLPLQGWYWQITPVGGPIDEGLFSDSLLEQRLILPDENRAERGDAGIAHFYLTDAAGTRLKAVEQTYSLYGGSRLYSFLVTGNFDELRAEMEAFNNALVLVLTLLGLGLLAALLIQVHYGLRPLRALEAELAAIRAGEGERLTTKYPEEISPVAKELNLLIQANSEVVERARTQVGNLAHALKTPLSVLANESRHNQSEFALKVSEQAAIMRDQVSLYLDRARRAARAQTLGSATMVEEVLDAIARTLTRIHMDRSIEIEVYCPPGLRFRGERQDLEEMIGNLLDNAGKWARKRIIVTASAPIVDPEHGRVWLDIEVADDGPGLPSEQRESALVRGIRIDETKPGSGLGLAIVAETAAMYNGGITLDQSGLGGLLARLRLPALPDLATGASSHASPERSDISQIETYAKGGT